jgi:ABC-2 type transport system ATP-binding protein
MPDITPPALQLQNVGKRIEKKAVLQNVDLTINKGEFFGLVGMNGAGKTTLIKCLLDFCALDSGSIEVFGVNHRLTEARSQIAYLPERFVPPYYLTGRNFIQYMLALQAIPYCTDEVERILRAVDLEPAALTQPVRSYSKGMTQKLGLAACFLSQNNLYILDEPMSGLDPKARILLKAHFQQLRAAGCTLFFSSHALADVIEICDRMAILYKGELRFVGSPTHCCERYAAATLEQAYMNCIAE